MMTINRREFFALGTFALLGASALKSTELFSPQVSQFDIYFHGLWAFIVSGTAITALTPENNEHCYLAGNTGGPLVALPTGSIRLSGTAAGAAQFDKTRNLILTLPAGVDPKSFRTQITLSHLPDSIESHRVSSIQLDDLGTVMMPLVQLLRYSVPQGESPAFDNLPGWNLVSTAGHTSIHFYAEPNRHVAETHAVAAMQDMLQKLNLKSKVKGSGTLGMGGSLDDRDLYELGVNCTPGTGTRQRTPTQKLDIKKRTGPDVANCMSIILTT